jgi:1-deoxy-D-xylulose-5-phosphate reductoisomerase
VRRRSVAVFGCTGSVGTSALDVIAHLPERFRVSALAAGRSVRRIAAQARRFRPRHVILTDPAACARARQSLGPGFDVGWGPGALLDAATADILVMAMSGTAGLLSVIHALERHKRVALATKEVLVAYGEPVMRLARRSRGELLPVDSELSAVHQCLAGRNPGDVRRVILTASGGPFRRSGPPDAATVGQVLRHPTWNMGRKITVDSATMMNKGLEVIETVRLLGIEPGRVETVIHPQSIVHSLVEFRDGAVLAQLSEPDMRLPLQYCLTYPERLPSLARPLSLTDVKRLEFQPLDRKRFPCLDLAYRALAADPAAPCALNAANQVAVEAFLSGKIAFGAIPGIIRATLTAHTARPQARRPGIKRLMRVEAWATEHAAGLVAGMTKRAS